MLLHADVWMLRPPDPVSMESVDMRHTLRWRPLQHACNTSVLYSVQFQGEFELTVLSGRWLNAPECQLIRHTHCDLTLDLGSDSDYNIRVRGPDAAWKSPTTVTVTVVVMAALLFAVFMSIVHWRPDVCQTYFRKEPIPNFLQPTGWDVQSPMSQQNLEVCERIVVVQSVDSDRRASNTDTPFPPHPEELGGELLLPLDCVESYHPQRPWDVPRYLSD
ncbi:hypothetical protein F2P81_000039 [Scophthalmus maximus]|uniref:Fibronectin type-III domain-containing protein n=1 Tax=Scophthalmus maximus TaxID=52904 RepID=A0A6A4TFR7_SCOMX|nr:hypothetical protein F2P81_000039 [Scophthalmus maximus]